VALVKWLIDTQGADVNGRTKLGNTALHGAKCPLVIRALLQREADPTLRDERGLTVLMSSVIRKGNSYKPRTVACLLEDKRVRDSINTTVTAGGSYRGSTAFHLACSQDADDVIPILRLLLEAGADPRLLDGEGRTPTQVFQQTRPYNFPPSPEKMAALAVLLKEAVESTREVYLIMVRRRLVMERQEVALREEGKGGDNSDENQDWRRLVAYVVSDLPAGMFANVMDLLLPAWAPLRRGLRK
jgi:hypothetical protein